MADPPRCLKESPSQTAGPYVHIGCAPNFAGLSGVFERDLGQVMVNAATKGERISITGRIFDGTGAPLRDAMIELWQADAAGLYPSPGERRGGADPNFTGFGRALTDMQTGDYRFETVKPGQVPFHDGRPQAPHVSLWIVARGINIGLNTRMYFPDEEEANRADPVLGQVEPGERVETLIARKVADGAYGFDIYLQGAGETVFFDI